MDSKHLVLLNNNKKQIGELGFGYFPLSLYM